MRRFAEVLEAISGTTSKRVKIDLLAEFLRSLSDEELRIASTLTCLEPLPLAAAMRPKAASIVASVRGVEKRSDRVLCASKSLAACPRSP